MKRWWWLEHDKSCSCPVPQRKEGWSTCPFTYYLGSIESNVVAVPRHSEMSFGSWLDSDEWEDEGVSRKGDCGHVQFNYYVSRIPIRSVDSSTFARLYDCACRTLEADLCNYNPRQVLWGARQEEEATKKHLHLSTTCTRGGVAAAALKIQISAISIAMSQWQYRSGRSKSCNLKPSSTRQKER